MICQPIEKIITPCVIDSIIYDTNTVNGRGYNDIFYCLL